MTVTLMSGCLTCLVFSSRALSTALDLKTGLQGAPWATPAGDSLGVGQIIAPQKLLARNQKLQGITAYSILAQTLAQLWPESRGLIFLGSVGIAVRAIAPLIRHKSCDPPVVVVDAGATFAISLLAGHWGGANSLARHVALVLGATPVITTASEIIGVSGRDESPDVAIQRAGLKILDWESMPALQGRLLENRIVPAFDPWRGLPPIKGIVRQAAMLPESSAEIQLTVHWKRMPQRAGRVRLALPIVHIGVGFRANITLDKLKNALVVFMLKYGIEPAAVAALATVREKYFLARQLGAELGIATHSYEASELSRISSPSPSAACAKRFGVSPFSVCEAAALLSARHQHHPAHILKGIGQPKAILPVCKKKYFGCVTLAMALASTLKSDNP